MYEQYYGFSEKPFSLTPDPRFLYRSESHGNAIELLQYAIDRHEGFAVITGDITQVDLPRAKQSGLIEVGRILRDIPGIDFHYFNGADVVRHPLVLKIIDAYERYKNPITETSGA